MPNRFSRDAQVRLKLGELLKKHRLARRLSQKRLAARLAKLPSWVSRIEHGRGRFFIGDFLAVCRVLELDAATILSQLTDNPTKRPRSAGKQKPRK